MCTTDELNLTNHLFPHERFRKSECSKIALPNMCGYSSFICQQKQPFWVPTNENHPVFTLADAANFIQPNPKNNNKTDDGVVPQLVKIAILGDSTMGHIHEDALCNLIRTTNVHPTKLTIASKYEFKTTHPKVYQRGLWIIEESEWLLFDNSSSTIPTKRLLLTFGKVDFVLVDEALIRLLCEKHDVILFNWGLWYSNHVKGPGPPGLSKFRSDFLTFLEIAQRVCSPQYNSLFYVSPVTQHFPYDVLGTYHSNYRFLYNYTCLNVSNQYFRASDIYTNALQEIHPLIFPSEQLIGQQQQTNLTVIKNGLRVIPFHDLTFNLHDQHIQSIAPGRRDCTHLFARHVSMPIFHTLGLFLLQQQQTTNLVTTSNIPITQESNYQQNQKYPPYNPIIPENEAKYSFKLDFIQKCLSKHPPGNSPGAFAALNWTSSQETIELMKRYSLGLS
jgi:hypothetical protein